MKKETKHEEEILLDQEDLQLLEEIRSFQRQDIYSEEGIDLLIDEEGISGEEYGFMIGFLAA